ncbi:hypothetical protein A9Q84_01325 [Halobacteriovorax marinus]|uniref:Uncharacterized protein n=1 Tax=Halobacteriovorax marinus TaxID=97084 RepID=A0A1Y5FHN3_9BACT|nr:hypothetical protein A9Q84_01325 [Halobacteriovorax marinus]
MNPFVDAEEFSDEQLMEKYQQGDYMAFEALYLRHESTVFTYLNKRMADSSAKEEIFQNIFLKLHKCKHLYNSEHLFIKWLYTISRSELLDFCKKKKMKTIEFDESLYQDSQTPKAEINLEDYKNLSDKEREAISLKYLSDEDYETISKKLNTSTSNARKLISRGLKKIRIKMTGGTDE